MFSYFEPNFIEKFPLGSDFSNFGQNRNDAKSKSVYLAAILKRFDIFFSPELWFLILHAYMVQISLQNSGEK